MLTETKRTDLFCEYYAKWITVYKKGAIRKVTMDKYLMTQKWLVKLVPNLRVCDMNRIAYQQLLNDYAEFHERQTTMDFHHQLKGAILDAVDEGLIERDPTRKAIIKGKPPVAKKIKYLNQFELHTLLISLDLKDKALRFLKAPVKIGLSGTPMNKAEDLWNILTWLDLHRTSQERM